MLNVYTRARVLIEALKDDRGQDLIEYALLAALIAVAAVAAEQTLGQSILTLFQGVNASL
jgi:pilus assembly protein Flp/PilA